MENAIFADRPGLRVVSVDIKKRILRALYEWWNHHTRDSFPGPQPGSIEREHFAKLKENPYWVCAKTDGMRFVMQCVCVEDTRYCVFIDRKNDMYLMDIQTTPDAFLGTVLDGELVKNHETNQYDFLVYDSIIACGEDTTHLMHSERMRKAQSIVSYITVSDRHNMHVRIKPSVRLDSFSEYKKHMLPTIPHTHDGLIFTPENNPVSTGTNFDMFKWKPREKNTVDFWVEQNFKHKNKFIVKLCKGKYMICLHDHYVHIPQSMREDLPGIVECMYTGRNNWSALLMRSDKVYPNSVFTMTKTLLNIQENIQIEEFETLLCNNNN